MKSSIITLLLAALSMTCPAMETGHAVAEGAEPDAPVTSEMSDSVNARAQRTRERIRHNLHRVDREIQKLTFVPKKAWFTGAAVSYNELDLDNVNFFVVQKIKGNGYTFSVSPCVGYLVKDNQAIGLRFNYNRSLVDIGNIDLSLGDDLNLNVSNVYYINHTCQVTGFYRTYMPLGRSKIFGFFSDVRLAYGYSQGKNTSGVYEDGNFDGTYAVTHSLHLGFAPGLTAFVQDWMAVEVQAGVMGFNFNWKDQVINQVDHGTQTNFSGKFKIDIFSISIGISIYM